MASISKKVLNCKKNGDFVVSALALKGDDVAHQLSVRFESDEEAFKRVLDDLVSGLKRDTEALVKYEEAYVLEQADDPPVRRERDEAAEALAERFRFMKKVVKLTAGEATMAKLGLDINLRHSPAALHTQASAVVGRLREANLTLKDEELGIQKDTLEFAEALKTMVDRLGVALTQVNTEKRELDVALLARDEAFDVWAATYHHVATILTELFSLAGFKDLAKRIRPSHSRATGKNAPEDLPQVEPPPTPAPQ